MRCSGYPAESRWLLPCGRKQQTGSGGGSRTAWLARRAIRYLDGALGAILRRGRLRSMAS
jgi:hypothetical protein